MSDRKMMDTSDDIEKALENINMIKACAQGASQIVNDYLMTGTKGDYNILWHKEYPIAFFPKDNPKRSSDVGFFAWLMRFWYENGSAVERILRHLQIDEPTEPSITLRELKALVEGMKRTPEKDSGPIITATCVGYNTALTDLYEAAEKGRK